MDRKWKHTNSREYKFRSRGSIDTNSLCIMALAEGRIYLIVEIFLCFPSVSPCYNHLNHLLKISLSLWCLVTPFKCSWAFISPFRRHLVRFCIFNSFTFPHKWIFLALWSSPLRSGTSWTELLMGSGLLPSRWWGVRAGTFPAQVHRFSHCKTQRKLWFWKLFGWGNERFAWGSKERQKVTSKAWLLLWGLLEFPCLGIPPYSK